MSELNIKTVGGNGTFEDVVADVNSDMQAIAHALRALLAEVMPNITEVPWGKQKIAGYGVGPKKMSEHFCYLAPQKNYVNLGFMYGADLPDPDGLMEGAGQVMRHIKIRSLDDVNKSAIKQLIIAASTHLPKLK